MKAGGAQCAPVVRECNEWWLFGAGCVTPAVFCGTLSVTVPEMVPVEVPDTSPPRAAVASG
jgi:hypothetical protein